MKKRIVGVAFAAAALSMTAAPAMAGGGTPNNCIGKWTSYVAQGNDITPFVSAHGIGNVAKANDATTQEAMGLIKFICFLGIPPPSGP